MKAYAILLLVLSSSLHAQQSTQSPYKAARGHYFYEDPIAPEENAQEKKHPKPIIPDKAALMKMHPEEFSRLFEDQLHYAMMTMSEEDTLAYYELVDVSRRRSRAFMGVTEFVMMRHPHLDMQTVDPINAPGRAEKQRQTEESKRRKLFENADRYALVMFASETCSACKSQISILDVFQRTYGFPVRIVDVNSARGMAKKYAVSRTPHTILISRNSDDWMPIGIGVKSMPVVVNKTYSAIRLLNNEIEPSQFYNVEIDSGEMYDPLYGISQGAEE
jgi:thioredoxin-related protein